MSTHTDTCGDTLNITSGGDHVYLEANEGSQMAELEFDKDSALAIVGDLLQSVGLPALGTTITPSALHGLNDDDERERWNADALQAAADHGRTATFRYSKADGRVVETRTLKPASLTDTREGHVLVTGYDTDRDEVRAYRLDRITNHVEVS